MWILVVPSLIFVWWMTLVFPSFKPLDALFFVYNSWLPLSAELQIRVSHGTMPDKKLDFVDVCGNPTFGLAWGLDRSNTKDYQFEAEGLLSTCPRKSQYTVYLTKFLGYQVQIVTWLVCPFNRILFAGLWCHKTHLWLLNIIRISILVDYLVIFYGYMSSKWSKIAFCICWTTSW